MELEGTGIWAVAGTEFDFEDAGNLAFEGSSATDDV